MVQPDGRPRVLFLCTGNSCRSQMAEGWARALHGADIDACSAGTAPHGIDPRAVAVMAEAGVDIGAHTSKTVAACAPDALDLVITVCGHAHEHCPVFSGPVRVLHHGFDDPPRLARELARDATGEDQILAAYRRVRDEIRAFVEGLPALLSPEGTHDA